MSHVLRNVMSRQGVFVTAWVILGAVPASAQPLPLGPDFQINSYTLDNQAGVAVSAIQAGGFVVVWQSFTQDGGSWGVFGQRFGSTGVPQGGEFRVNSYTTNRQLGPVVSSGSSGSFTVVWTGEAQDGSDFGIFGQRYDSGAVPQGAEFQVNAHTTGTQTWPSVSSSSSGGFVVVWQSYGQDGSDFGVFGQRYDSAGVPQGGEFRVNSYTTGGQILPMVASDAAGSFVVVWQGFGQDGDGYGIFGQRYDSVGAAQGGEFRVNTYTTFSQASPTVAAEAAGGFVVVWESSDGHASGLFARRYDVQGLPQGPEFAVNSYTTGAQSSPALALAGSGGFVVSWEDSGQDGSDFGIFGRRFDSAGAAQGGEFAVNAFTTGRQLRASVAAHSSGTFVVAWESFSPDGSGYGAFGRRFGPDLVFRDGFETT
jgi:hypothetical protein